MRISLAPRHTGLLVAGTAVAGFPRPIGSAGPVGRLLRRADLFEDPVGAVGPGGLAGPIGRRLDVTLRRVQALVSEQRLDLGRRRAVFGEATGEV